MKILEGKSNSKKKILCFFITLCVAATTLSIFTNTKSYDYNAHFTNKYDMFSYVAFQAKSNIGNGIKLIFPEGGLFEKVSIVQSGNSLTYICDGYEIVISKIIKEGSSYFYEYEEQNEYYRSAGYLVERIEVNGVKYLLISNGLVYFVMDGYGISIRSSNYPKYATDIYKVIEDLNFVMYDFIDNDVARGKLYNESKKMNYTLNDSEFQLMYKYSEVNYMQGFEYDVYSDGVNEYMFDSNNSLIGYNIKDDKQFISFDEISKYFDAELFTKEIDEKNEDGSHYVYRKYINGLKTNEFAKIRTDKNGNINEYMLNKGKIDISSIVFTINNDSLVENVKYKLNEIFRLRYKVNYFNIEDTQISLDQNNEPIIMCTVNANIYAIKWDNIKKRNYNTDSEDALIIISIKSEDCVKGVSLMKGRNFSMSTRQLKIFIFIIIGAILILLFISSVLKNTFMVTCFYKNNDLLSKEENKEIKKLLLNVMKNRHSTVFSMDEKELYTEDLDEDTSTLEKSFWIYINYNFMNSVKKKNDNEYTAKIQMKSPDDWCYYFTIKNIDGKYIVSYFEIDP